MENSWANNRLTENTYKEKPVSEIFTGGSQKLQHIPRNVDDHPHAKGYGHAQDKSWEGPKPSL